jgi:sortase A
MSGITSTDTVPAAESVRAPAARRRLPRLRHKVGTALIVLGFLALAYGAAVYFWRDPVTDLYARWKQHQLGAQLEELTAEYRSTAPAVVAPASSPTLHDSAAPAEAPGASAPAATDEAAPADVLTSQVRQAALAFYQSLELGQPLGRIIIDRLDIHPVFVNGTRWGADLSRGPGRYPETAMPGLGKVTAIAGHRTTFGAPFRHIDRLQAGDTITLELPYGTFRYVVTGHEIVEKDDWSIIRDRGVDTLVLSACHPLYSASQRWIVYGRLSEVELPDGRSYTVAATLKSTAATGSG